MLIGASQDEHRRQINILSDFGVYKRRYIYQFMCIAFSGDENRTVDHIDSNCRHDHLANLRWATTAENNSYRESPRAPNRSTRAVWQIDAHTSTDITRFSSLVNAAKAVNPHSTVKSAASYIGRACRYKLSAYGYKWRYEELELPGEVFTPINP